MTEDNAEPDTDRNRSIDRHLGEDRSIPRRDFLQGTLVAAAAALSGPLLKAYAAHAAESGNPPPPAPIYFTKPPTTVIGPGDPVPYPQRLTTRLDWEVELGVVIGMRGRDIPEARALDYVFGYTIFNDVSARDLQYRTSQWFKGKALDGSCPMGPVIVSADEIPDPQRLRLQLRVNGVTKQNSNTGDMIFSVARIIEDLSAGMTLEPGDCISTGTPQGVGDGRKPPEYLKPGDVIEAEVERIGVLRNPVR